MRISVILSTYNQPKWLEKAIWGYATQSHRDFELVIADDGSGDETRAVIERLQRETGIAMKHVWQEDQGFRKCTILNRAIIESSADYLVFSDGDCIPRFDFLAAHAAQARRGHFLSGGYVKLTLSLSQLITSQDILLRRATDAAWLRKQGLPWNRKLVKLTAGPLLGTMFDTFTTTKATWNGHNASGWKADILRVNGFDERMEWGAEDREMGERLVNLGIHGIRVRYRAICIHLEHERSYVRAEALRRNREIRKHTRHCHATWTADGIVKHPQPLARSAA